MISDTITQKIGEAMKARDEIRLSTLKLLSSALSYEKIALQHDLTEEEETAVVRREAKKRKEAIEVYEKAKATDRAEKEKKELAILQEFLPPEMNEEELSKIVDGVIAEVGAKGAGDIGKVMGATMAKLGGKVDGNRVAELVRNKLA